MSLNRDINTPLFSNQTSQITLKDIANCKGQSRSFFAKIRSQINTLWHKGTLITDAHVKKAILEGNDQLMRDLFEHTVLDKPDQAIVEDLSLIIGKKARTLLEQMEVPVTKMVAVNELRKAAENASKMPKTTLPSLRPGLSDELNAIWANVRALYFSIRAKFARDTNDASYYKFRAKKLLYQSNLYTSTEDIKRHGKQLLGFSINLVQKPHKDDIPAIVKEKETLREEIKGRLRVLDPTALIQDGPITPLHTKGICMGIMIDLAENYFSFSEDKRTGSHLMDQINFEKGGTIRAEIYQGAYLFPYGPSFKKFFKAVHDKLARAKQQSDTTLAKVLPDASEDHVQLLKGYLNLGVIVNLFSNPQAIENFGSKKAFLFPGREDIEGQHLDRGGFRYIIVQAIEQVDQTQWMKKNDANDLYIDYPLLQQVLIKEIDIVFKEEMNKRSADKDYLLKRREQLVGEVKLAIAMEELTHEKQVSDPLLKHLFVTSTNLKEEAILSMKGYTFSPVSSLGTHFNYVDDAAYLKNLNHLKPGFYAIFLSTKGGRHAISLVINPDASMHVFDPNVGILSCKDSQEAAQELVKLLSTYEEPTNDKVPGHPSHQLEIFQLDQNKSLL